MSGNRTTTTPTRTPAPDADREAEPQPKPDSGPEDDSPSKSRRLARYLRAEARAAGGELYFKGKFIADDVGLSPKEIGALMPRLQESASELSIEPWSYTGATTWRVETQ